MLAASLGVVGPLALLRSRRRELLGQILLEGPFLREAWSLPLPEMPPTLRLVYFYRIFLLRASASSWLRRVVLGVPRSIRML